MKLVLPCFIFLVILPVFGQNSGLQTIEKNRFDIKARHFWGFDNLGYYYFSENNVLFKQKDKELFQFKNLALGSLSNVDLQNPLRLLLFFENFNRISTLDNQLNEIQTDDFSTLSPSLFVSAVGMASQNQIWCYDVLTQKILLYNLNHKSTKAISAQLSDKIQAYQSNLNYFYFIDLQNNAFKINLFGKIEALGKTASFTKIKFISDAIILIQNSEGLFYQNLKTDKIEPIKIDEKIITDFTYQNQILSIFTGEQIINYTLILP